MTHVGSPPPAISGILGAGEDLGCHIRIIDEHTMSRDQTYHVTHLGENKQKIEVSPKTFI